MELPGIAKMSTLVDVEDLDQKDGLKMVQDHQIIPKKIPNYNKLHYFMQSNKIDKPVIHVIKEHFSSQQSYNYY